MDYSSIINLALITVIYSTFISPNLAKLSKIKEDILNLEFPATVSAEGDAPKFKMKGVTLSKKFAQYSTKYYEIKKFLKFFYIIVTLLVIYQIYRVIFVVGVTFDNALTVFSSVVVIVLLVISVNKYMSTPSMIRSFGWLVRGGIAPIYLKHMYNAQLTVNLLSRNEKEAISKGIRIGIRSDVGFDGYNYILTVESTDSRFLYYVSAGKTGEYHTPTNLVYDNGKQNSEILIGSPILKPGQYKVRLLFNGGFFRGIQPVYETIANITVDSDEHVNSISKKISLGDGSENTNYTFTLNENRRIKSINLQHSLTNENESIERLLAFERFAKIIGKSKRSIVILDSTGQIDGALLRQKLSKLNLWRSKIARYIHRKANRTLSYRL